MATSAIAECTPSHVCYGCIQKTRSIAELEKCISALRGSRLNETDSEIVLGAGLPVSSAEMDTTIPMKDLFAPVTPCAVQPDSSSPVAHKTTPTPQPHPQPGIPWSTLGAIPKRRSVLLFTPNPRRSSHCSSPHEFPWNLVTGKRAGRTSPSSINEIRVSNRFDALNLDEFPLLDSKNCESPTIPKPPKTISSRKNTRSWETEPAAMSLHPPQESRSAPGPELAKSSPRPLFPPTTLIVGDSMIRKVRFFNALTHCLPGATVPVILDKLPGILDTLPATVNKIIVHTGFNDTARRQTELTKAAFKSLLSFLRSTGKAIFISGPIPALACKSERFSRVLSLHTWLQSASRDFAASFIDNFNLFWNRPSFFSVDGIHPNLLGSRILATNVQHNVQHNAPTVITRIAHD